VGERRRLDDQRFRALAGTYLRIKRELVDAGYAAEIDWQDGLRPAEITESHLLRETAWVILSSGFSERSVRARFPSISAAFFGWRSASAIVSNRARCRRRAVAAFANVPKVDAILEFASYLCTAGFESVREAFLEDPIPFLTQFRYLGPVTSRHLAKNLGVRLSKPDRHLLRVSSAAGYTSPEELCCDLADGLDESVGVVDLVIWRHAVLWRDYEATWSHGASEVAGAMQS
jgi:hypothetical protein